MKIFESLHSAMTSLLANKMRSMLTMLGVIIGVGFVILLVSLGAGAREEITANIQGMGSNMIMVAPFNIDLSGGISNMSSQAGAFMGVNRLSMQNIEDLSRALGDPDRVMPLFQKSGTMFNGRNQFSGMVMGTGHTYLAARGLEIAEGRFFTPSEQDSASAVVVLGQTGKKALFGDTDPIGKYITLKGRRLKVIGIQEEKGNMMMMDQDAFTYVPYTTATRIFGVNQPDMITISSETPDMVEPTVKLANEILSQSLSDDEFTIITQDDALSFAEDMTLILTYLLGGMASISLLVGGIGIMNIMLVSVTERTREIGIRKAVGAKTSDIMIQFLVESVMISLVGGIIGIIIAVIGSTGYTLILGMPATITPWIVVLAFFFSASVGIFFGVYPARKASLLDPIESLRYE
ncbi:MAG: ABC transporter permease [Actinobacteria bacterium]|nr:ABC transporter permease [Actinomycetota bacterium]